MLQLGRTVYLFNRRTYKNFGHKREPIPLVTTFWHGFLTLTFIGLAVQWKQITKFFFGEEDSKPIEEACNVTSQSSMN